MRYRRDLLILLLLLTTIGLVSSRWSNIRATVTEFSQVHNRDRLMKKAQQTRQIRDEINKFCQSEALGQHPNDADFQEQLDQLYRLLARDDWGFNFPRTELLEAEKSIEVSHRHFYECLSALKQSRSAEIDSKEKLKALAQHEFRKAWALSVNGGSAIESELGVTGR
jgi:hypothetical protein